MAHSPDLIGNPFRRSKNVSLVLCVGFLATGIFSLAVGIALQNWVIGLGIVALFCWLFSILPFLWYRAQTRWIDRCLDRPAKRDYLAAWTYTGEEWEEFQKADTAVKRKEAYKGMLICAGVGVLVGVVVTIANVTAANDHPDPSDAATAVAVSIAVTALFLIGGPLAIYSWHSYQRARFRAMRDAPPPSYVGRDFVFANNEFIVWGVLNFSLLDVHLLDGPPVMLEFLLKWESMNPDAPDTQLTRRVLVPTGRKQEAEGVLQALTRGRRESQPTKGK